MNLVNLGVIGGCNKYLNECESKWLNKSRVDEDTLHEYIN